MRKNQARVISLLSVIVFLLLLLLCNRLFFRLDLTKNKAYTISEVSKNLYREISGEVRITYFVSDKLRQAHPIPGEIADLLREYAANSKGKIRFIQKDPAKAEMTQDVERLGISPQQIQLTEKNEITVAMVYTGILIEYLNKEDVIPVVFSLDTLEYDITSRIRALVRGVEREIGVIVGDPDKQWDSEYGLLNRELYYSGFRIRQINPTEAIPPGLPVLFVLGGAGELEIDALINIDNYILGGGNVFFAVDGIYVDTRRGFEASAIQDKGLFAMLANYGVIVQQALVLDRTALNLTFQTQNRNGTFIQTIRYPEWIGLPQQAGNHDHPVTSGFSGLDLYWASPLELNPPPLVQGEILFTSSDQGWLQSERLVTNPNLFSQFEEEAFRTTGTKNLGVSLSGIFPAAFPELENNSPGKPSRIIVVGNSLFAGTMMQLNRGEERNLSFLVKAADWLSSDDDIASIRGRDTSSGRLDRISDRSKRDAVIAVSKTVNTIIIPLIVIFAGGLYVWKRKMKTSTKGKSIE